jgi:hypothetical protein
VVLNAPSEALSVAGHSPTSAAPAEPDGSSLVRPVIERVAQTSFGDLLAGDRSARQRPGSGPIDPDPGENTPGATPRAQPDGRAREVAEAGADLPAPQRSHLLTNFTLPDRAALERAIDRFLSQFQDLGARGSVGRGSTDLLAEILALAVALTTVKVGFKLLGRPPREEAALGETDVCLLLDAFPGPRDP